ncbi:MAG: 16S rRNA (uracil(1498)-N(3))-methyltransferase [Alphaproteobacteria bacterium]|nr:16S rRNA (uracil(1498)-N(3))-methyltransferase [Alphaproteobacteria bacterium]MBV9061729.1 16S rRNA (uracil(1498)-N(3))-methyltransferase [Alphaproteobacteria bacterium]
MNDHLSEPGGKVRLFVEAPLAEAAHVQASEAQAHYLLHVMRARAGDRVSLFNGHDGEWLAQIRDVKKSGCAFGCEQQTRTQVDTPDLWLCFAPIKKTPADYLTQKATELGVSVLQPVITRRTIVSRVNTGRMRANAIEASEQSERLSVPEIREPVLLEKLIAAWPTERQLIFCDEAGQAPPLAQVLRGATSAWAVLTGPEGGFDPTEREMIRSKPFVTPVSLGPRILRADTAGLAAVAVWQALAGDWR